MGNGPTPLMVRGSQDLGYELRQLLAVVAGDVADGRSPADARTSATTLTRLLVERGLLPGHLTVRPEDPPVVVARTLAAALRTLARDRG